MTTDNTNDHAEAGNEAADNHGDRRGQRSTRSGTTAAVAALARELEALRERLEPLDGLDEQLSDLANTVADLANEVAARDPKVAGEAALSWLDLPDGAGGTEPLAAAEVERLLGELVVWVERVYLRYADATKHFPECWLWHPDVVEELTWLRHAWQAAYRTEDAGKALAWDWHDRYRPGVVRRITALAGRCSLDNHTRRTVGGAPVACGLSGLGELAGWWATDRHSAPPTPSADVLEQAHDAEAARLRDGGR